MFKFLEKYLMGPMSKISQLRLVRAITAAGMASIPFTIVGSMFLVLTILPDVITPLQGIWDATFLKVTNIYMLANKASMGIIGLYFLLVISYEYTRIIAEEEEIEKMNPINGMLLSVFGFFMLIPQFAKEAGFKLLTDISELEKGGSAVINGWAVGGDGLSRLGATGIFTAIITSWLVVNIYKFCIKKNLIVKMPEEVPSGVANSFSALIPTAVLSFVIFIIQGVLVSLNTDLFQIIQVPFGFVTKIAGTLPGVLVIHLLIHALWVVGIHGATIISSLVSPIVLQNMQANAQGASIPFAGEFYNAFSYPGGSGATLGLVVMCIFLARSEQLKAIGKSAIVPGLFNINEPVIFGMPVVYNPILAIPFMVAPMVGASIGYLSIASGFVRPIIAQQPWPTPFGIGAFIATGGDYKGAIVAVISVVVSGLIYYPFFKAYDKKLLKQQEEGVDELADVL